MKFVALIRAQVLDRSQADQVNSFNELLSELTDYYFNGTKKPKKTVEDQVKLMDEFKKFKGEKFKLNNFKKVKNGRNARL